MPLPRSFARALLTAGRTEKNPSRDRKGVKEPGAALKICKRYETNPSSWMHPPEGGFHVTFTKRRPSRFSARPL